MGKSQLIVTHFWSIEEEKFLPGSEKPSHKYLAKEAKTDFEQYLFAKTCLSCALPQLKSASFVPTNTIF